MQNAQNNLYPSLYAVELSLSGPSSPLAGSETSKKSSDLSFSGSEVSLVQDVTEQVAERGPVYSLAKWHKSLKGVCRAKSYPARIEALKKLCTQDKEDGPWRMQLEVNGQLLDCVLYKGPYATSAIAKEHFEGKGKQGQKPQEYYFFHIYEKQNPSDTILLMRFGIEGMYGEVKNIYTRSNISGNEVKTKLSLPLLEALKVRYIFKHDDSMKPLQVGERVVMINLYTLLPIITKANTPEEGTTWYSRHDFTPVDCAKLRFPEKNYYHTLDKFYYFAAVERLRTTTLQHLHDKVFATSAEDQKLVKSLYERYITDVTVKGKENDFHNTTLPELGGAIFAKATAKKEGEQKVQATADLASFYERIISERKLTQESSSEWHIYNVALKTLGIHYLWVRDFSEPKNNMSYRQFKAMPHRPFEEMISKVTLSHDSTWYTIANALFANRASTHFMNNRDKVSVQTLRRDELEKELERIQEALTPLQAVRELCLISTQDHFEVDAEAFYWQLWIESGRGSQRSYLELLIEPEDEGFTLTLKQDKGGDVLFEADVDENGCKIITQQDGGEFANIVTGLSVLFSKK